MQASPGAAVRFGPRFALLVSITVTAGIVAACYHTFELNDGFVARSLTAYAAGTGFVLVLARIHLGPGRFGPANCVTLLRGALLAPLLGVLGEMPTVTLAWLSIQLAVAGLLLDGVDGRIARCSGQITRFGARFDMETDALLILLLSALCWHFDKAGVWILTAGLLRYAFVAAGRSLPWMRRDLPPSRRRQTACVVQSIALLLCLSPLLSPPWSSAAGGIGLVLLGWSFLIDLLWLAKSK